MNNASFSILSTLLETLRLAARNFVLILTISVLISFPFSLATLIANALSSSSQVLLAALISLLVFGAGIVVGAMKSAAILGVLKSRSAEASLWPSIGTSVRTYTWTLIRLEILLTVIAWIVTFPFGLLAGFFGAQAIHHGNGQHMAQPIFQFFLVFIAVLYLVFVKYALADPLIVIEDMLARPALYKSWDMTKGRFWYVLGCYIFLGTAEFLVSRIFEAPGPSDTFNLASFLNQLTISLFDCLWVFLAWCMYWRIKGTSADTRPPAFVA